MGTADLDLQRGCRVRAVLTGNAAAQACEQRTQTGLAWRLTLAPCRLAGAQLSMAVSDRWRQLRMPAMVWVPSLLSRR